MPIVLDAYSTGGLLSKDIVVVPANGPDTGPAYYSEFPRTWGSDWYIALSRGSSQGGQPIAKLTRGGSGLSGGDIEVALVDHGFWTVLARADLFSKSHRFEGMYGGRFEWRRAGFLSSTLEVSDGLQLFLICEVGCLGLPGRAGGRVS